MQKRADIRNGSNPGNEWIYTENQILIYTLHFAAGMALFCRLNE